MIHMVLSIAVMWHEVDEITPEFFFFFFFNLEKKKSLAFSPNKKEKKEKEKSIRLAYSWDVVGNKKLDCRAWDQMADGK